MKPPLPLVALACFGLGVAADRIFFVPSPARSPEAVRTQEPLSAKSPSAIAPAENSATTPAAGDLFERIERGDVVDFQVAADSIEAMPSGDRRRELIHQLARRWVISDPFAALDWASGLSGSERREAMETALHHWAQEDPAAAVEYAADLPKSERSLDDVHHLAREWAEQDRAAALAWSMAQDDPAIRERALRGTVSVWAMHDPAAAADFAAGLENTFERRGVIEEVAHRWARESSDDALDWATSLPADDRRRATREIMHQVAADDPHRAAMIYDQLAETSPSMGERERRTIRHLARELAGHWASTSPAEAARWAMALPTAHEVQRAAVREVTEQWLRIDSLAASKWVSVQPAGETRDAAAGILVEHVSDTGDHESALAWATTVGDEEHQTDLMHHVFGRWVDNEPEIARRAYDTTELQPEQREHLDEIFGLQAERDEDG